MEKLEKFLVEKSNEQLMEEVQKSSKVYMNILLTVTKCFDSRINTVVERVQRGTQRDFERCFKQMKA